MLFFYFAAVRLSRAATPRHFFRLPGVLFSVVYLFFALPFVSLLSVAALLPPFRSLWVPSRVPDLV